MELKVYENNKKRMVFELIGADHTLCNALKKELWNDSCVRAAAYRVEHPLIRIPRFIIETNGKKAAKTAVKSAVTHMKRQNTSFLNAFKKAKQAG